MCHTARPKAIDVVEAVLDLPADALEHTRNSLRQHGNPSSVSLLDVLRSQLTDPPAEGSTGLMIAMGPGFCYRTRTARLVTLVDTVGMYYLLIFAVALERVAELVVAKRNARWSFARGGKEFGQSHYPVMVVLHTALLLGCVIEPLALHRPFIPWLGWPMLAIAALSQLLRWWCITTLGPRWNTRVIVVPDAPLVQGGPYRWIHHPNYVAVVAEGFALPLIHTAWLTAVIFTLANAMLLRARINVENSALGYA
ncbi:hypothetical protein MSAS_21480 [Mycobacterium saskatchewanense]|nr:hypothetical protein MSAS_21480 [Mycobacterium saskatchewanense]